MPRRTQSWDARGKDTSRGHSFDENSFIYFQRPVTLAFPRVLETFWLSLIRFRRTLISYFCCLNFSCRSNFSASRL